MRMRISGSGQALNRAIARMVNEVGADLGTTIKRQARLTAVEFSQRTQPFGHGASAQARGQNRIAADIAKVYPTLGAAYEILKRRDPRLAAAFWQANKRGDTRAMHGILLSAGMSGMEGWDGGAAHQNARRSLIKRGRANAVVWLTPAGHRRKAAYIKREQKRVGKAKSGWATCARRIGGTRGIPGWVSRNRGEGTVVDRSQRRMSPYIDIINRVRYIGDVLSEADIRRGLATTAARMTGQINAILRARARKFERSR